MNRATLVLNFLFVSLLFSFVHFREGYATTNRVEYTLITADSPDCPDSTAFPKPELQYRRWRTDNWTTIFSKLILYLYVYHWLLPYIQTDRTYVLLENYNSTENMAHIRVWSYLSELSDIDESLQNGSQLKFVQREHRGGFCDCWAMANLTVNHVK